MGATSRSERDGRGFRGAAGFRWGENSGSTGVGDDSNDDIGDDGDVGAGSGGRVGGSNTGVST